MALIFPDDYFVCRKFIPVTRNEKCNCTVQNLLNFFEYSNHDNWSELVGMVAARDITGLRSFMGENHRMRIVDRHGNNPLHIAIVLNKMQVFDFLLKEELVHVDAMNRYGQTGLHLGAIAENEYVINELLRKGADIHAVDEASCTALHAAATRVSPRMCRVFVDRGADMNLQNLLGKTPIYLACQYGTIETVCMLLYYGADVTITDRYGVLPLTVAMQGSFERGAVPQLHEELHQILFNHTFENNKVRVGLSLVLSAMRVRSKLFPELLDKIDDVFYCKNDLIELGRHAMQYDIDYLKQFMNKFRYVMVDMLKNHPTSLYYPITHAAEQNSDVEGKTLELIDFLTMLFKFKRSFNFVKGSSAFSQFVYVLLRLHRDGKMSMDVLVKAVCFLYSEGLICEMNHLIAIYETCGFCQLFKDLLHMDIHVTYEPPRSLMPYMMCDVHMTIDILLNYVTRPLKEYRSALKFFSSPRVKNFFARDPEASDQLARLPQVPMLVELARNAARKHILKRFRIKKPRDFYSLLKKMPINEVYKKILTFEKELYPYNPKVKLEPLR